MLTVCMWPATPTTGVMSLERNPMNAIPLGWHSQGSNATEAPAKGNTPEPLPEGSIRYEISPME